MPLGFIVTGRVVGFLWVGQEMLIFLWCWLQTPKRENGPTPYASLKPLLSRVLFGEDPLCNKRDRFRAGTSLRLCTQTLRMAGRGFDSR